MSSSCIIITSKYGIVDMVRMKQIIYRSKKTPAIMNNAVKLVIPFFLTFLADVAEIYIPQSCTSCLKNTEHIYSDNIPDSLYKGIQDLFYCLKGYYIYYNNKKESTYKSNPHNFSNKH